MFPHSVVRRATRYSLRLGLVLGLLLLLFVLLATPATAAPSWPEVTDTWKFMQQMVDLSGGKVLSIGTPTGLDAAPEHLLLEDLDQAKTWDLTPGGVDVLSASLDGNTVAYSDSGGDVYLIDLTTGSTRLLAAKVADGEGVRLRLREGRIVWVVLGLVPHDLTLYDVAAGTKTAVSGPDDEIGDYRFDGEHVLYDLAHAAAGLHLYTVSTGTGTVLSGTADAKVYGGGYDVGGSVAVWRGDQSLAMVVYDLTAHTAKKITCEGNLRWWAPGVSTDGDHVLYWTVKDSPSGTFSAQKVMAYNVATGATLDVTSIVGEAESLLVSGSHFACSSFSAHRVSVKGGLLPASSGPPVYTSMIGADRYLTAVKVSQAGFPTGAPVVVLVTGEKFPDALSAAPLARAYGGPVLLTPLSGLTDPVKAELRRLNPATVFCIGLPRARFLTQVGSLLPSATVTVLAGKDRYQTAVLVAKQLKAKLGSIGRAVIAPGDRFPDALSAASLAAAKGWALLLTPAKGPLNSYTAQALTDLGLTDALVVGASITPAPSYPDIITDGDQYKRNVAVVEEALAGGLNLAHVAVVKGDNFPDGLAAAPYLALDGGSLFLSPSGGLAAPVADYLWEHASEIKRVDFIGVPAPVISNLKKILGQ